jgi:hypothetical protein
VSLEELLCACLPLVASTEPSRQATAKSSDDDDDDDDEEEAGDPTEEAVEAALREAAVVDAGCFLRHVRRARAAAKHAPRLARLESHGELVVALEAAKAANHRARRPSADVKADAEATASPSERDAAGPRAAAPAPAVDRGTDLEGLD